MDTASLIIRMISALAIILGLMAAIVFLLKKWGGVGTRTNKGYIQVVENRLILPKRHISLIKVAGTYFLIGSTEHGMNLIGTMDREEMESFHNMMEKSGKEELKIQ